MEKYVHHSYKHNLTAPNIIVPDLVEEFAPRSVVDIGCGIGTFLSVFESLGVRDILGIDGDWIDQSKLYIAPEHFLAADLETPLDLGREFDMAICVEVAEHLRPQAAGTLVETLCNSSNVIIFSAAIPGQGGFGHLNEQPYEYWQKRFAAKGYFFYDIFRERYWQIEAIDWWYRQNLFLVVHESVALPDTISAKKIIARASIYVHPEVYARKIAQIASANDTLRRTSSLRGLLGLTRDLIYARLGRVNRARVSDEVSESKH